MTRTYNVVFSSFPWSRQYVDLFEAPIPGTPYLAEACTTQSHTKHVSEVLPEPNDSNLLKPVLPDSAESGIARAHSHDLLKIVAVRFWSETQNSSHRETFKSFRHNCGVRRDY
jgi:hypothetical protein